LKEGGTFRYQGNQREHNSYRALGFEVGIGEGALHEEIIGMETSRKKEKGEGKKQGIQKKGDEY